MTPSAVNADATACVIPDLIQNPTFLRILSNDDDEVFDEKEV
jgi:hypothetical protein